jgi:hypothetical protein
MVEVLATEHFGDIEITETLTDQEITQRFDEITAPLEDMDTAELDVLRDQPTAKTWGGKDVWPDSKA